MARFKDQAVCIRLIDWSETSQVVALFTREHGKVRGLAKGSKRTSPGAVARFSGGIELLTRGEVMATIKASSELAAITEWDLQEPFSHLRTDLSAHRLGMYAADFVGALTAEHDAHPKVFEAMVGFLTRLGGQSAEAQAALLGFQWAVLEDCGFKPELSRDVRTGEDVASAKPQALYFDPIAGGITRLDGVGSYGSRVSDAGPWRVRGETIELLRELAGGGSVEAKDDERVKRANRLLCVYTRAILDRELPTMRFVLEE